MSKALSPQATADLNAVLRRACDRMERRQKLGLASQEEVERLLSAVVALENEEALQREAAKAAWADVEIEVHA